MKNFFPLSVLLFLFSKISAQDITYPHTTSWFNLGITKSINEKWDIYAVATIKKQNNYHHTNTNPFDTEFSELYRLWLYYKLNNQTVLQFNPISFSHSKPLYGKESDYLKPDNQEWRSAIGIETTQKFKKFTFKEKQTYELRWIKSLGYEPIGRLRLKNTVQYALTKRLKIGVWDDLQLAMPPNHSFGFDQNWFAGGLGFNCNTKILLEAYYMRNRIARSTTNEFDVDNGIYLSLEIKL